MKLFAKTLTNRIVACSRPGYYSSMDPFVQNTTELNSAKISHQIPILDFLYDQLYTLVMISL